MAKLEINVPDELLDYLVKNDSNITKKMVLDSIKNDLERDLETYAETFAAKARLAGLPKPTATEKKLTKELNEIGKEILTDDIQAIAAEIAKQNLKPPRYQLTPLDFEKFDGVNLQSTDRNMPNSSEQTLALYLVNITKGEAKRFTVTANLVNLLNRGTRRLQFGTTTKAGTHQSKMILQWEREIRE